MIVQLPSHLKSPAGSSDLGAACWLSGFLLCRPSWSVGEWGVCSRSCGGGEQTRQVQCVQRTSQTNVDDLADSGCAQPTPARRQACNTHSCPPVWTIGPWSQVRLLRNQAKKWTGTKKENQRLNPSSDGSTTFYKSDLSGFKRCNVPSETSHVLFSVQCLSIVPADLFHS